MSTRKGVLIQSRPVGESIIIGDNTEITVTGLRGNLVRLGITAPREIEVHRGSVGDASRGPRPNRPAGCSSRG
jgi:carbon storage regulator